MARQLRAAGEPVGFVGLIDPNTHPNAAPWLYWRDPDAGAVMFLRRGIALMEIARARTGLRRGGLPSGPRREAGESDDRYGRRRQIWAGITEALAHYRPRPYDGPVTVFGSTQRIARLVRWFPGWSALAAQREVFDFAGGHQDLFERSLPQLAATLRRVLDQAHLSAAPVSRGVDARQEGNGERAA
jgi:thioesterase domain-containing protein